MTLSSTRYFWTAHRSTLNSFKWKHDEQEGGDAVRQQGAACSTKGTSLKVIKLVCV